MQITVNGKKVTVDDSFRDLSPELQDKTVDEIAAAMGGGTSVMDQIAGQVAEMRGANQQPAPPIDPSNNPQNSVLPGFLGQLSNTIRAATEGGMQATTLNMGDELFAGADTLVKGATGQGWDYGGNLANAEQASADLQALNPDAANAGRLWGSVGLLGKSPVKTGAPPLPLSPWMPARAAATGGLYSATYAAGEPGSIPERVSRAREALLPGAALGWAFGKGAKVLSTPSTTAAVPSVKELFRESKAGFETVKKSGATVQQPSLVNYRDELRTLLDDEGLMTPNGEVAAFPRVKLVVDLADGYAGGPMTAAQALKFRRAVARAAKSPDGDERAIGVMMLKQFDDFAEKSLPPNIASLWRQARVNYHLGSKGETVEKLILAAERQHRKSRAVGIDQALRNKFDAFIGKDRNLRGFTPAERAQLGQVSDGTLGGNAARMVGGLAPSSAAGLTLKGSIPAIAGTVLSGGNPIVGAAVAATSLGIGGIGRFIANMSSKHQAQLASLIIRNGGKLPAKIPAQLPPEVKKALGNLILAGGSRADEIGRQIVQLISPSQTTGQSVAR